MNAEAVQLFLDRATVCKELHEAVMAELQSSDRCGLGRYKNNIRPCVIGERDIDRWISLDDQRPRGIRRNEFLGVCDKRVTIEDISAMIFGG